MPRRQFRQFEEIFEPRDRTALRLFNEWIDRTRIGPCRRHVRRRPLGIHVIDAPLTPSPIGIYLLETPATPRMERMRDREEAFCFMI